MLLANRKEGRSVRLLREVPGEKLPENKEQAQSTTGFVGFHTGSVTLKDRPKARPKTPIPLSDRHAPPQWSPGGLQRQGGWAPLARAMREVVNAAAPHPQEAMPSLEQKINSNSAS